MPPPLTGVLGAQDIIEQGTTGALQTLGQGIGTARGDIEAGGEGMERQAALAGLRGNEAQAAAFEGFNESPGQAFLREQAERSLTRNAAATGTLGGGNVLQELQRQAIGLAQQDFQNQFQRGQQVLGSQQQQGRDLAGLSAQGGVLGANIISGAASQLGGQRFQAGQDLSRQAASTAANIANLQNQAGQQQAQTVGQGATNLANIMQQLGVNLSGTTGQAGTNIANILSQLGQQQAGTTGQQATNAANVAQGAGQNAANLQQQLATILANIGTGGASQAAQLQTLAGQFDAAGTQGQNAAVQNAISQLIQLQGQGGFDTGAGIDQQIANATGVITPAG